MEWRARHLMSLLSACVVASCGASKSLGNDGGSISDGQGEPREVSSGEAGDTPAGGGSCTGSIDQVQAAAFHIGSGPACPATYDEAIQTPPTCGQPYTPNTFGPCGGALVVSTNCLLHGFVCVYDVTSRGLVGAAAFDDTPAYCQLSSTCIQGGTLPAEIACTAISLRMSCGSGADDGGMSDGATFDTP